MEPNRKLPIRFARPNRFESIRSSESIRIDSNLFSQLYHATSFIKGWAQRGPQLSQGGRGPCPPLRTASVWQNIVHFVHILIVQARSQNRGPRKSESNSP